MSSPEPIANSLASPEDSVPIVAPLNRTPHEGSEVAIEAASEVTAANLTLVHFATEFRTDPPPLPTAADFASDFTQIRFASYRHLRPLRVWRDGAAYQAFHSTLHRDVELRLLDADVCRATDQVERFLDLARSLANIRHPNVHTTLFEAGVFANTAFVAADLADVDPIEPEGQRLPEERIDFFPLAVWAKRLRQAAEGLQALHDAGLRHGFLRAECLCLDRQDRLVICHVGEAPEGAPSKSQGDQSVDRELASLAGAFLKLLIGRERLPSKHVGEFVRDAKRLNPDVPAPLLRLLARCLWLDGTARLYSAEDLAKAAKPLERSVVAVGFWGRWLAGFYDLIPMLIIASGLLALTFFTLRAGPRGISEGIVTWIAIGLICLFHMIQETVLGSSLLRLARGHWLADYSGFSPSSLRLLVRWWLRFFLILAFPFVPVSFALSVEFHERSVEAGIILASLPLCLLTYVFGWFIYGKASLHDAWTGLCWSRYSDDVETPTFQPGSSIDAHLAAAPDPGHEEPIVDAQVRHYRLGKVLGRGGMGSVYKAHDESLNRKVAIKLIHGGYEGNPVAVKRFEREAQLAARVRHEHVAQVYDGGTWNGAPYMVMELLHGCTLQQWIQSRGPLPVAAAWKYVRQAASGLAEADRLGIIHRDIKPSNLILTAGDIVKITDFGLSKLSGAEDDEPHGDQVAPTENVSLTRTGTVMGTPQYMSPEQATGKPLDRRSDIYSLGLTLYALLAGRPPFDSKDIQTLISQQCGEHPASLLGSVQGLTAGQWDVLCQMTEKRPGHRHQTYEELLEDLDAEGPKPATLAAINTRLAAELVNSLLFGVVSLGIMTVLGRFGESVFRYVYPPVEIFLWATVFVWWIGHYGQHLGKLLFRLKVVNVEDGEPPGYLRALLRSMMLQPASIVSPFGTLFPELTLAVILIGSAMPLFWIATCICAHLRHDRRGLHDLVAGTQVIQLPK